MASDVVDLRDFYRSGLGQVARRMIRRAIQRVWPDLHGMRLVGIGYATPFLGALSPDTEPDWPDASVEKSWLESTQYRSRSNG